LTTYNKDLMMMTWRIRLRLRRRCA